jgi:hypothetical protein
VQRLLKIDEWHPATHFKSSNKCLNNLVRKNVAVARYLQSGQVRYSLRPPLPLKNFYFTFGSGHEHGPNGYVKVSAASYGDARTTMVTFYGNKWAFQYDEEQFLPQIEKYNLHLVKSL